MWNRCEEWPTRRRDLSRHSRDAYLFAKGRLGDALDQQGNRLDAAISAMSPEHVRREDAELETELLGEFRVEPVNLRRSDIATQTREEDVDVRWDRNRLIRDRTRPFMMRGARVSFFVPFDGDATLLSLTPSSFTTVFPEGEVNGSEIVVHYVGVGDDAQRIKGQFEANLAQIERYLAWSTKDVEAFNSGLPARIQSGLAARRSKVDSDQALADGLGYKKRTHSPGQARAAVVQPANKRDAAISPAPVPVARPSVEELVRIGESRHVEFKSSIRWDRRLNKVNKALQDEVMQCIAAFLNSGGGDLLIGIADDRTTVGVEDDLRTFSRGGEDALLRTIGSLSADRVGPEFDRFIDVGLEDFGGKRICRVHVDGAPKPAYLDGSLFFIRGGPATRQLDPRGTVEYVRTHWRP